MRPPTSQEIRDGFYAAADVIKIYNSDNTYLVYYATLKMSGYLEEFNEQNQHKGYKVSSVVDQYKELTSLGVFVNRKSKIFTGMSGENQNKERFAIQRNHEICEKTVKYEKERCEWEQYGVDYYEIVLIKTVLMERNREDIIDIKEGKLRKDKGAETFVDFVNSFLEECGKQVACTTKVEKLKVDNINYHGIKGKTVSGELCGQN